MRAYTIKEYDNLQIVSWEDLKTEEDGAVLDCALLKPLSVSFQGTFGEGAKAILEGSVADHALFFTLKSHQNFPIATRVEGLFEIRNSCLFLKPRISGGAPSTKISVYLLCKTIPKRRLGR